MIVLNNAYTLVRPFSQLNYEISISPIVVSLCEYQAGTNRYFYSENSQYRDFSYIRWCQSLSESEEQNKLQEKLGGEMLELDSDGLILPGSETIYPDYKIIRESLFEDNSLKVYRKNEKELFVTKGSAIIGGVWAIFSSFQMNIHVDDLLIKFSENETLSPGDYFVTICPKYFPLYYGENSKSLFEKDNCFVAGLISFSSWKTYVTENYTSEKYQGLFCNLAVASLVESGGDLNISNVIQETYIDNDSNSAVVWSRRSHLYPYVREDLYTIENGVAVVDFGIE